MAKQRFFAQAYQTSDGIVISYRGTDAPSDVVYGWTTGAGILFEQSEFAAKFYYEVVAEFPTENIILTGHSLGGGLAGFVAKLTGREAYIYDRHMANSVRYVKQDKLCDRTSFE